MEPEREIEDQEEEVEFVETVLIKRTEHDDIDKISEWVDTPYCSSVLKTIYRYESLHNLVETSFMSLTVCDSTNTPFGIVVFNDFPQGLVLKSDFQHHNLWENWLYQMFHLENHINPHNTLWLSFSFINKSNSELPIDAKTEVKIMERVFKEVYKYHTSVENIGFHLLGVAGEDRHAINEISGLIENLFGESERKSEREVDPKLRAYSKDSRIFFSGRSLLVETLEIRGAIQQDHDDLAAIFNEQSEVPTDTYGQFFIAELIAAQNEDRKAIVAQVGQKAVGLMSVTKDIDYELLSKNFELEPYDNLCKSEFMDAFRAQEQVVQAAEKMEAELERMTVKKKLRNEITQTKNIGQRMVLQQHLSNQELQIRQDIDKIKSMKEDDMKKTLHKPYILEMLGGWLKGFKIYIPSMLIATEKILDPTLVCRTIDELEFFLETLEFFGLPKGYMDGGGHWFDWERKKLEEKKNQNQRQGFLGGRKPRRNRRREEDNQDDMKPPIYFDIEPLEKAMNKFLILTAETRANFLEKIAENIKKVRLLFCNQDGEPNKTRCQDMNELGQTLINQKIHSFSQQLNEIVGVMLKCFGDLAYGEEVVKIEEKHKEEKKEENEKEKEKKKKKTAPQEAAANEKKAEPQEIRYVDKFIWRSSWEEFMASLETIRSYDLVLSELGLIKSNILKFQVQQRLEEEAAAEAAIRKKYTLEPSKLAASSLMKGLNEFENIPDVPPEYQNAVCINIFCIDEAFETRSIDFMPYVFKLFPDRDFVILTQPHIVEETPLLQHFVQVPKKKNVNFDHVLYIFHKASLISPSIVVRRSQNEDLEYGEYLFNGLINGEEIKREFEKAVANPHGMLYCFSAYLGEDVIGLYLMAKTAPVDYYQSHFTIQYHMLLDAYGPDAHCRLKYSLINPLFQKSRKFILREIMRVMNKTAMYFEVQDKTVLPDVWNDMVPARSLRFPGFLERKWDHEWDLEHQTSVKRPLTDLEPDRDPFDQVDATFALSLLTKSMLSISKVVNNTRIVVIGASDTGLSFLESLLSTKYVQYPYLYLLAPGGLAHMHVEHEKGMLKAMSPHYSLAELKNLMIDAQVTLIDGSMTHFDRKKKQIFIKSIRSQTSSSVNYDLMVITVGFKDKTKLELKREFQKIDEDLDHSIHLNEMEEEPPEDVEAEPIHTEIRAIIPEQATYVYSIDDPQLYTLFSLGSKGTPMEYILHKRRPQNVLVLGRNLDAVCFCCGLVERGVPPKQIYLVIPPRTWRDKKEFQSNQERVDWEDNKMQDADAFDDEFAHAQAVAALREIGISVFENSLLWEVFMETEYPNEIKKVTVQNKVTKVENELPCSVIVTSYLRDIDTPMFKAIQDNGLVYNGRLIVKNNFQTTDDFIFAGGKICEFSQRYKNFTLGRPLRMDKYSSREVGQRMARSVLEYMNILYPVSHNSPDFEQLPVFHMPIGEGAYIVKNLIYFHVTSVSKALPTRLIEEKPNRPPVVCSNFEEASPMKHYIRFVFNNYGQVESCYYMVTHPFGLSLIEPIAIHFSVAFHFSIAIHVPLSGACFSFHIFSVFPSRDCFSWELGKRENQNPEFDGIHWAL